MSTATKMAAETKPATNFDGTAVLASWIDTEAVIACDGFRGCGELCAHSWRHVNMQDGYRLTETDAGGDGFNPESNPEVFVPADIYNINVSEATGTGYCGNCNQILFFGEATV